MNAIDRFRTRGAEAFGAFTGTVAVSE